MKSIGKLIRNEYKQEQLNQLKEDIGVVETIIDTRRSHSLVLSLILSCSSFIFLIISIYFFAGAYTWSNKQQDPISKADVYLFLETHTDKYVENPVSVTPIYIQDELCFLNIYFGIKEDQSVYVFELISSTAKTINIDVVDIGSISVGKNQSPEQAIDGPSHSYDSSNEFSQLTGPTSKLTITISTDTEDIVVIVDVTDIINYFTP
jgi:hypothetical protein